ncbi:hypothetical protein HanHA300_Chr01g0030081 [Helianthus annuus]|nr:hypothetical protein HanHA300_Chr01g0030081 [Helianthus annuus]KAJ0624227.1 hypothetical protein HanIR_Chr01g0040871 [Helianthus annuus]KAJ0784333.1 hypothetical protein HanLR1_Chr01g0030941 [Helianthus annuus]KAJ0793538.1 hypothetical protein HanOQP8_Chr01g0030541 [Helianthus annuus]
MAEEEKQIELKDEAADLAPFDPAKKKKKKKVVIQDPAEDSVEELVEKTDSLSGNRTSHAYIYIYIGQRSVRNHSLLREPREPV